MRGATMGATKDYSQYKVAKSMQEGEEQFSELLRLLLKTSSWPIVLAVSEQIFTTFCDLYIPDYARIQGPYRARILVRRDHLRVKMD